MKGYKTSCVSWVAPSEALGSLHSPVARLAQDNECHLWTLRATFSTAPVIALCQTKKHSRARAVQFLVQSVPTKIYHHSFADRSGCIPCMERSWGTNTRPSTGLPEAGAQCPLRLAHGAVDSLFYYRQIEINFCRKWERYWMGASHGDW